MIRELLTPSFRTLLIFLFISFIVKGSAQTTPNFGSASNFVLFTSTGAIGNTGTSNITGDIGTNTGAITGFESPSIVNGNIHIVDSVTAQAAIDLLAAYLQLQNTVATNITHAPEFGGGEVLTPGVYSVGAAASVAETLVLDGQGNHDAQFIFKIGGALTTGANTTISLINGAIAEHIFWIADGAIAMAASTTIEGTLIANGAISLGAAGILHGKIYSITGAVNIYGTTARCSGGGSVAADQSICTGTQPMDLILSGNTGTVVRWEKSTDAIFNTPINITNTTNTLTGAAIGNLTATTYFRAVVQIGNDTTTTSTSARVAINLGQSPDFGTAGNFILYTVTGEVSNAGISNISGNIGTNAGAISGFEAPTVVTGTIHNTDAITLQASSDLTAVYNQLFNTPQTAYHAPAFGAGETLTPGVYVIGGAGSVAGTLNLDGQGNPNSVFIFRFGGAFTTAACATIVLLNGATAENIFWVADGAISMAASTTMCGTLIANNGAISMGSGGVLHGRLYSTTGAVSVYNCVAVAVGDGVGGTVSANQTICQGTTPQSLSLSGNTRSVLKWQHAPDANFTSPTDIANTSNLLSALEIGNLTSTTYFRAVVQRGICGIIYSASAIVSINQATVGVVSSNQSICRGTIPADLTLSGNTENVLKWQYANDAAFTNGLTDIVSTATTLNGSNMGPITATRYYRAVVQNGSCGSKNTDPVQIAIPAVLTYANGVWNGTPSAATSVIIASSLTLNANLHVCSCQVINMAIVTVASGMNLIVEKEIAVDATANILVENDASIVQVDDSALNSGQITVKRVTTPMKRFDFTYWSSPVNNQRLFDLSPNTLSDKYYSFNPTIGNWITHNNGAVDMQIAKGYIVRAPQSFSTALATPYIDGQFIGTPNNGLIHAPIIVGSSNNMNLIGNPYPSAIDIDLFIADPTNAALAGGTVYLWTHNSAPALIPGDATYNYSSNDYASYNIVGGVATSTLGNNQRPTGKIASGQSFFIKGIANGQAIFNNSMRIVSENNHFFKHAVSNRSTAMEKDRFWLNLTNSQGAFKQALLGFVPGATNGPDNNFDGLSFDGNSFINLYSIANNQKYCIQGRALPFDENQTIPLGYSTTIAGTFSINLDQYEGLFASQSIFLLDNLTNSLQNIKTAAYQFTTLAGTFDHRFELKFMDSTGQLRQLTPDNSKTVVSTSEHKVIVKSDSAISSVKVFDLSGRTIYEKNNIDATLFTSDNLMIQNQVIIVKIQMNNGSAVTSKLGI